MFQCAYKDCEKKAVYVEKTNKTIFFCIKHKRENMAKYSELCGNPICEKFGNYKDKTLNKKFCSIHRTDNAKRSGTGTCGVEGCTKNAIHKAVGYHKLYCVDHVPKDKELKGGLCKIDGCYKRAKYGESDEYASRCREHKSLTMILSSGKCEIETCNTHASYGFDSKKAVRCAEHKDNNMIFLRKITLCEVENCEKIAYYITEVGHFCIDHRKPGQQRTNGGRECGVDGCTTIAHYGFPNEGKLIRCSKHQDQGMENLSKVVCTYPGCESTASYGLDGEKSRCGEHKDTDMNHSYTCKYEGCNKAPNFNYPEMKQAYCSEHAEDGMVDVKHKKCENDGCNVSASFAYPGEPAILCGSHKRENMINVNAKYCIAENCIKHATFGKLFSEKQHCGDHNFANEYSKNNPKCSLANCKERPCYTNDKTNYPQRCFTHKISGDINVVEQKCSSCGLLDIINTDTLLCNACNTFIHQKPRKKEEEHIKALLEKHYKLYAYDKVIDRTCNLKRPDFVLDFNSFFVVVEVDEHQHLGSGYSCECEIARTGMVHQQFGGAPVVFIRYNPHNYKTNGKTVKASKTRETVLLDVLRDLSNTKSIDQPLLVLHLFYDGYTGVNEFFSLDYINSKIEKVTL